MIVTFSCFYPRAAASPVISGLPLARQSFRWSQAPKVLAHPLFDGSRAVLDPGRTVTAAGRQVHAGDAQSW